MSLIFSRVEIIVSMCLYVIVMEFFIKVKLWVDVRTMTGWEPIDPSVEEEMVGRS